jgi:hypothetical protein
VSYAGALSYPGGQSYAWALALTLAVEVPIYAAALRAARLLPIGPAAVVGLAVNLVTHPFVWLLLLGAGAVYRPVFAVLEVSAWLVEAGLVYLRVERDGRPILLVALVANTGSILAGLLLL